MYLHLKIKYVSFYYAKYHVLYYKLDSDKKRYIDSFQTFALEIN